MKYEPKSLCLNCGRQQQRNLHPDSGLPERLNELGAMIGCLSCAEIRANGRRVMFEKLIQELKKERAETERESKSVSPTLTRPILMSRIRTIDWVLAMLDVLENSRRESFRDSVSKITTQRS